MEQRLEFIREYETELFTMTELAVRRRHPRWGPKKLLAVVRRDDPDASWPARATVATLLKRQG
jgi:hypothetical protein